MPPGRRREGRSGQRARQANWIEPQLRHDSPSKCQRQRETLLVTELHKHELNLTLKKKVETTNTQYIQLAHLADTPWYPETLTEMKHATSKQAALLQVRH